MARAVLILKRSLRAVTLSILALLAAEPGAAQPPCSINKSQAVPPAEAHEAILLQQRVMAGPFFKELQRRSGDFYRCSLEYGDGSIRLTFAFSHDERLTVQLDPQIELSEQTLKIPRMESAQALSLFRKAEIDSYPPAGCGIKWDKAKETSKTRLGLRKVWYRGASCSCAATLTYQGDHVVELSLSSAC